MESIFGIPVRWAPYTEAYVSCTPGIKIILFAPGKHRSWYHLTIRWNQNDFIQVCDEQMCEVFSQARKELVKTGHRVFGGKS